MHRVCSVCGEPKPLSAFRRSFKSSDGYHAYCKGCGPQKSSSAKALRRKKLRDQLECGVRTCNRCHRTLPADTQHFMPEPRWTAGLTSTCRDCLNAYRREQPSQPYVRTQPYDPVYLAREEAKANGMLRCPRCERVLPATSAFWNRCSTSATGFQNKCRVCEREAKHPWGAFDRSSKRLTSVLRSAVRLRDDLRQAAHDAALQEEGLRICSKCGVAYPDDAVFFSKGSPECKLCARSRMNRRSRAEGRAPRRLLTPAERKMAERLQAKASAHRRRARKRNNGGNHTPADIRRIFAEQEGRCAYCLEPLGPDFHEDHKVPLARGGSNGAENICCACPECNVAKGTMTDAEFREERSARGH